MGFHEKSALACLISICAVYLPYFAVVLQFPMAALGLFWLSVVGLVVLLIGFHVAIALSTRSVRRTGDTPPSDELDRRIRGAAAEWAGFVLGFAVLTWILVAMYTLPAAGASSPFTVPVLAAMTSIHWLFAAFVFANAVYYAGIVAGYRSMARA